MNVEEFIQRCETLDPERERMCLERFLYSLTGMNRLLVPRIRDPQTRFRMLARVSEISRYTLKRVLALAMREKDTYYTVAHTWHSVHEHVSDVPELDEWVTRLADSCLKMHGA